MRIPRKVHDVAALIRTWWVVSVFTLSHEILNCKCEHYIENNQPFKSQELRRIKSSLHKVNVNRPAPWKIFDHWISYTFKNNIAINANKRRFI